MSVLLQDPVALLLDTLVRLDNSCGATTTADAESWREVMHAHFAVKRSLRPPVARDVVTLVSDALAFLVQRGAERQRAEELTRTAGQLIADLFSWNPVSPGWRNADPFARPAAPEARQRYEEDCKAATESWNWFMATCKEVHRVCQEMRFLAASVGVNVAVLPFCERSEPRSAPDEARAENAGRSVAGPIASDLNAVLDSVLTHLRYNWRILFDKTWDYAEGLNAVTINSLAADLRRGPVFEQESSGNWRIVKVRHPSPSRPAITWTVGTNGWEHASELQEDMESARNNSAKFTDTLDYLQSWRDAAQIAIKLGQSADANSIDIPAPPVCPGCGSPPAADDIDDVCPRCGAYHFRCGLIVMWPLPVNRHSPPVQPIVQQGRQPHWERIPPSQVVLPVRSPSPVVDSASHLEHPAEVPIDPPRKRITVEIANQKVLELAERDRFFVHRSQREWAAAIGCGVGLVSKLPLWKETMKRSGRGKEGNAPAPKVMSLTSNLEAVTGEGNRDEVLEQLIAEQEADAEPSPLDEVDPHSRRKRIRSRKRL